MVLLLEAALASGDPVGVQRWLKTSLPDSCVTLAK